MLTDTHCHLNLMVKNFDPILLTDAQLKQIGIIVDQAAANNVTRIITIGTNLVESINSMKIAQQYPGVFASVGIHPTDATHNWKKELKELEAWLQKKVENKIVAIGETGIDLYHAKDTLQRQQDLFRAQIELALEYDVALVVHTRNAHDETLSCLEEYKKQITHGVIHCYSEDQAFAGTVIEQGFVLGIGGALTYPKNKDLQKIFTNIPLEKIILETDAPFLPPQPIRGKQNHPREIKTIAQFLTQLRGISLEAVGQQTTANAERVFQLRRYEDNDS